MKAVLKSVIPIDPMKYVIEFSSADDANMFRAIFATAQEKAQKIISSFGIATKRRSLSANAYAWTLMNQLAAKINRPVLDIYRDLIRDIGAAQPSSPSAPMLQRHSRTAGRARARAGKSINSMK